MIHMDFKGELSNFIHKTIEKYFQLYKNKYLNSFTDKFAHCLILCITIFIFSRTYRSNDCSYHLHAIS